MKEFELPKFQFLIGSLEVVVLNERLVDLVAFQFLIGSLEVVAASDVVLCLQKVSIPYR